MSLLPAACLADLRVRGNLFYHQAFFSYQITKVRKKINICTKWDFFLWVFFKKNIFASTEKRYYTQREKRPNSYHFMKNLLISIFAILLFFVSCQTRDRNNTLRIIHAGSLSLPVKQIVEAYHKAYPDVRILTEAWGSKAGARQITELKKNCDVYISADDVIIESFLMPDYASWSIPFAGNEMVLAYKPGSRYADDINADNWFEILARPGVFTARSNPDMDPCGVRSVIMLMLADLYYEDDNISQRLLEKDRNFMRPKEADLIALLEKRSVDYLYIYKSMAIQHGFEYLTLPDSINLSRPELADFYAQVSFETVGNTPDSRYTEVGAPIVYGITIPLIAQNKELALHFIAFFLNNEKGMKILEANGQNSLLPAQSKFSEHVPEELQQFLITFEI